MVLYIFKCCYYSPTRILWTLSYISSKMLIKCCGKHNMIGFFGILTHKFWTHEKHVFHWKNSLHWQTPSQSCGPCPETDTFLRWNLECWRLIDPICSQSTLQRKKQNEKNKNKTKTQNKEQPLLGFLPFSVCAWHAQVTWWWEKDQVNGKRLQVRGQVEVRSGCRTSTQVCCLWKRAEGGEGLTVMGAVEKPENHVLTLGKKGTCLRWGFFPPVVIWFYGFIGRVSHKICPGTSFK